MPLPPRDDLCNFYSLIISNTDKIIGFYRLLPGMLMNMRTTTPPSPSLLKTQQQTHPHMHQRAQLPRPIAEDDRSETRPGYRAIKRTVIPLPGATKHVTILLGPRRSEPCQNMTEDRTFFSPGECFNYRVASSRNASAQMSVRSSPLCVDDSFF